MESFRWIAAALSMILGLAVTRVLSGLVEVFRARSTARLDWIPVAWAMILFVMQLQFWWAVIELQDLVQTWTLASFLLLVSLPLLLFLAAALVLPGQRMEPGDSLAGFFERDGRWGLAAISAYLVVAVVVDWHFWRESSLAGDGLLNLLLPAIPVAAMFARRRALQVACTVAFVVLYLVEALLISPPAYG
jgi:hypothetical protein